MGVGFVSRLYPTVSSGVLSEFAAIASAEHGPPHDQHQQQARAQGFEQNPGHATPPVAMVGLGDCRQPGGLLERARANTRTGIVSHRARVPPGARLNQPGTHDPAASGPQQQKPLGGQWLA